MSWRASAYIKTLVVCPNGDRISRTEKLVALVLADSHQDKGKTFTFPAVKMIAEDALMDPRVCRRVLAALERKGVIERHRAERQGRGQLTFYKFPALDEEGGHSVLLSERAAEPVLPAERRTEGGRKEDKISVPSYGVTGTGTKAKTTPPNPLAGEGERILDLVVDQVCSALAVSNRRKRRLLRDVIALEATKGDLPATIASAMIAAWNAQAVNGPVLRVKFGLARFFGEGIWKDHRRWHWNEELLRNQAGARVGS